jgi:hypothetical protein
VAITKNRPINPRIFQIGGEGTACSGGGLCVALGDDGISVNVGFIRVGVFVMVIVGVEVEEGTLRMICVEVGNGVLADVGVLVRVLVGISVLVAVNVNVFVNVGAGVLVDVAVKV